MKLLVSFGIFMFAMSFCGLGDRIAKLRGGDSSGNSSNTSTSSSPSTTTPKSGDAEKPTLTDQQQAIQNSAEKVSWDDQGISWMLPNGWKKMNTGKETFNYSSPDQAFLLVNISPMQGNFPVDVSLKAYFDSSVEQIKNGKYEKARLLEIDGVKGVEFTETMPEDKSGPRRHQWLAYRTYQGQVQMLNVMLSTKGNNFEKHGDDFPAILYSMKIGK
jgi:hypothetical protein